MASTAKVASETLPQYAQVAVPVHLAKTFSYRLPASLQRDVRVGSRVMVPLGTKPVTGYVVALLPALREGTSLVESEIKEVEQLLDADPPLTPQVLEITRWVAEYYAAPWGEVLRAALPAGINATVEEIVSITDEGRKQLAALENLPVPPAVAGRSGKPSVKARALQLLADEGNFELKTFCLRIGVLRTPKCLRELEREGLVTRSHRARSTFTRAKRRRAVRLVNSSTSDAADLRMTKAQQRVIEILQANQNQLAIAELLEAAQISESAVRTLRKRGALEEFEQEVRRDPLASAALPIAEEFKLTHEQASALSAIEEPLKQKKFSSFLLHGITSSGKTEVYIRAMRSALAQGRGAMMLVPEIALTPILSRRLRAHFGDQIAIFHSSLSKGERFDEWSRVRRGEARLVIGTRSAVFAPIEDLGLIIVDEEHDTSYRQQESPLYHARDAAIVRAQKESAVVVLGSATPSLESFHNAQTGKYGYLHLQNRIANRPLARAELIDMRAAFARHKRPVTFSDELSGAIAQTHARGEQSIILLNRRGYSSFILCRSCGESIMCPNCDVTLTYHRADRTLVCHYCNHRQAAPAQCPACGSKYIYYVGEGTEQIEDELRKRFPALRIARIDRDTASRRHLFEKALFDFAKGEIDMLVGTQMLAKGHDFPNVTLVGVISVDAGLALPDFRAAERGFQLITQVAGRAGRGDLPGKVLIQTYHPEHYALRHASAQDYLGFYNEELRHRRNHGYPPFVALASLLVHHKELRQAQAIALRLRTALNEANADRAARVLGPAPAPLSRLRGEHRIHLLVKSRNRKNLRRVIDNALSRAELSDVELRSVSVEIDPVSMM
jgi:primosomal protein N' (replication factor Y) (superfamily II helicase)